ncbi:MAG: ribose-phosphate pyrophosphokinase [Planctomycetes bacterium]|nr:ribose-phosphate pyrophosphokinase [Planctomycetota bacterium]
MNRGERLRVFTGTAHQTLAQDICAHMGVPLGAASLARFPDGEINLKLEMDVRGADVFVIQPTCPNVHEHLFELLSFADCLRRASADRITAVIPYFGYARKDRKDEGRVPINAKLVANLLVTSGYNRVLTIDLHAAQIQGFFDIPVDHLYARPVMIERVRQLATKDVMIVSPDVGGVKLARAYAKDLGCDLAIIDKRRISGEQTVIEHVIGEVKNRDVVLVDDMVSTGGSIVDAARIVKEKGARKVFIVATHAVLCGNAVDKLNKAEVEKILFADTIPIADKKISRLEIVSVAQLLARAIERIHRSESVSKLFEPGAP